MNGVPRGKVVWLKGRNITFRVSAGRYRIIASGDGVSVSARGRVRPSWTAIPIRSVTPGTFRVGDSQLDPVPDESTKTSVRVG